MSRYLTLETLTAIRVAHQHASANAFFVGKPQEDNRDRRSLFEQGFTRGFDTGVSASRNRPQLNEVPDFERISVDSPEVPPECREDWRALGNRWDSACADNVEQDGFLMGWMMRDSRATVPLRLLESPIAWLEAEPSAEGSSAADVLFGLTHSTRWHRGPNRPATENPVWPIYSPRNRSIGA